MNDVPVLSRVPEVVARFPSRRVLVVGDIMLDEYVFGTVGRISPEAPVPVVAVTREMKVPGGAANVALNLCGLRAGVEMAGLLGDDAAGRFVARTLKGKRIGVSSAIVDPDRRTPVKTRVIAHSQQVVRVDREHKSPPSRATCDALLRKALTALADVDGVVFSDYGKGALTAELVGEVIAAATRKGIFVAVDPKRSDLSFYRGCTVITPNKGEAQAALGGRELVTDLDVWEAGKDLLRAGRSKAILITRGEEGMTLVERGRNACFHVPAFARQVFDVTGAGDTVIGTLAACLAAGSSMREAAVLANLAASVVVGEVGTAPITAEKLLLAAGMRERPAPPRSSRRGVPPMGAGQGAVRASRRRGTPA
jgi:D-beta-D-heptose 7-phosphate kinase/D-beta-D-heptose 1-phosphate adenosyltransferase